MYQDVFERRLSMKEAEMKSLYLDIYHGDYTAYEKFVGMLRNSYENRPLSLRKRDEQRLDDPGWYKGNNLTGMLLYVKAFAGTLENLRSRLDYIEECGVNYLHLMPLLESPEGRSDGGYAVSDFCRVQPEPVSQTIC